MKHRTRYALALTLVATTICAGHLFASDRNTRTESRVATEKLVARLTRGFSAAVSRCPLVVQQRRTTPVAAPLITVSTARWHSVALSPFESNLPPPLV